MFNKLLADMNRFFYGRNGFDQLAFATILAGTVLRIVARITGILALRYLYYAAILWTIFRVLSRNITQRQRENDAFLSFWHRISGAGRRNQTSYQDGDPYTYLRCPDCKQALRVPKGRGTVNIRCPRCGGSILKHV